MKPPLILHSQSRKQNQVYPLLPGSSPTSRRDTDCRWWAVVLRTFVVALFLGLLVSAEAAQTTLAWDRSQNTDVVGYRVHYGTSTGKYDKTVDVGNTTTTTVTNLTAETSYYFVVTAYNSAQLESLASNEVAGRTAAETIQTTLAWDPSKDSAVIGYRVRYGTSSGSYDKTIDVGSKTSATVSGLNAGSSYFFAVTAYTSAQSESLPSNEVVVQAQGSQTLLSDPTRLAAKAIAPNQKETAAATENSSESGSATGTETNSEAQEDAGAESKAAKAAYIGVITAPNLSAENAGAISVNTTAAGKFTGKLTYAGKNYGLKGQFDQTGVASVSVPRANGTPLTVKLQTSASGLNGELSGKVSDGTTESEIHGDRTAKTVASGADGKWTVLFSAADAQSSDETAPQSQGVGYASIQVTRNGAARVSGALGDGTVFSKGTAVSKNNYVYLYVPLYRNRGVLVGVLALKSGSETDGAIAGTAQWIRPADQAGKSPEPESFQLELSATGERYRKSAAPQPGAGFPSANGISTITLSGGALTEPLTRTLSISAAGKVTVTDVGSEQLKVTLNVTNGTFSGSFRDGGAKKPRQFSGAVLQTQAVGAGVFRGTGDAGSVTLVPKK